MFAAFDPTLMVGMFSGPEWAQSSLDKGAEQKNGVSAHHYLIDSTTAVGGFSGVPAGASINLWIADEGYLVALGIDRDGRRRHVDPGDRRGRPGQQGRTPQPEPRPRAGRLRDQGVWSRGSAPDRSSSRRSQMPATSAPTAGTADHAVNSSSTTAMTIWICASESSTTPESRRVAIASTLSPS